MAVRGPLPSWVWLLLAAGLVVFALVWWSQDDLAEGAPEPTLQKTGRQPVPSGGDFSSVVRDRPIEPRERAMPGAVWTPGGEAAPARGVAGSASAPP